MKLEVSGLKQAKILHVFITKNTKGHTGNAIQNQIDSSYFLAQLHL